MKECILLLIVIVLLSMGTSQARELQIIHTNDLHSYFQGYGNGSGGYARLKTKIE
jgi:2',3'-cyclic-nucleotide 2'-phosphodiesterase (5'-nucleotidase family)